MEKRMLVNLKAFLFDNMRYYLNQLYKKYDGLIAPGEFRREEVQLGHNFRETLRDTLFLNGSTMTEFDQEYYNVLKDHVATFKGDCRMYCHRISVNLYEIAITKE